MHSREVQMGEITVGDQLRANYADYYPDGESEWRRLGAIDKADNIVSLCREFPHITVLEIGAGEGSILKRLSELNFGAELYGIEISSSGVDTIRARRIPRLVECRLFDGSQVPYDNDQFDLAVLSHVLEHVEHPRQLLYEASRVAKYVCVEVPLDDMSRLRRDFVLDRVGHINFYSPRTIRWLVQSCNLCVLRQITTNPSKATYRYSAGRWGVLHYYVNQGLLGLFPELAPKHFSFHGTLVCAKNPQ